MEKRNGDTFRRGGRNQRFRFFSLLGTALCIGVSFSACAPPDRSGDTKSKVEAVRQQNAGTPRTDWRTYLGDDAVTHSSPLAEINRQTVGRLTVAWRYDAGDADPAGSSQIQFNPLVVKGVLYAASPSLRLFALDAANGDELWSFRPEVTVEQWTVSRGAVYWEDTKGADGDREERIFFGAGPWLYALDALRGEPITDFGDGGRVDLREGLGRDFSSDLMGVVLTTPPVLFEDLLIVGGRVNELAGAAPGHVRALDVRTGEVRWIFHTIPQPGEFGFDTWPADAWRRVGGVNAWAGMSVDAERGLVFVPTGSPDGDFFGGDRAGDNLFANSLLALDARTGKRRWHSQLVRHDLWDRDLPAPPNLVTIERDGERIPAVAQVTKTGDTFLFERESGATIFPLREVAVAGPSLEGEAPAASQPLPSRPGPFVRQTFSLASVTDYSPEARAVVRARIEGMRYGGLYTPPSVEGTIQYPGVDGGAEWGGAAWDEKSGLLFVNANQVPYIVQMVAVEEGFDPFSSMAGGYLLACSSCHGTDMKGDGAGTPGLIGISERMSFLDLYRVVRDGRGRMPGFGSFAPWWQLGALSAFVYFADEEDAPASWATAEGPLEFINAGYQRLVDHERLPGSKPPWGTLSAIDLAAGEIRWQIALGDYPQVKAAGRSGLGAENYGGPIVTAGGLLFLAATPDAKFRAFDTSTGALVWQGDLPAAGFATPATYEAGGRQFVVIAAGGGKLNQPSGSEYVAFALAPPETLPGGS